MTKRFKLQTEAHKLHADTLHVIMQHLLALFVAAAADRCYRCTR